jgi:hypothetical protein
MKKKIRMILHIYIYIDVFQFDNIQILISFLFFFDRGGKHRRFLSWEKIRDFIVKQNDARGDAFGMDYYDQKAKDLVKKYTQHDKEFKEKGFINCSFISNYFKLIFF